MGIGGAGAMNTTIATAAADMMTTVGAAVVTLVIAIAVAELHHLRGKQPFRQAYSSVVCRGHTANVGQIKLSARGNLQGMNFLLPRLLRMWMWMNLNRLYETNGYRGSTIV